jgi:hypothetical protein
MPSSNPGVHASAGFNRPAMIAFGSGAPGGKHAAGGAGSPAYSGSIGWTLDIAGQAAP